MAKVVCKAGYKSGIRCEHKRNAGGGLVLCAINATPEVCRDAEDSTEHVKNKMAILGVKKEDLA